MKDLSSKTQMDIKLDILAKVQKVDTPTNLYDDIISKIDKKRKNTISITWIRSVAAGFFVLLAVEAYIISSNTLSSDSQNTANIEVLIPSDNNTIYND
jgi:formate/nitrite transporter FocA (FNT family)